MVSREMTTELRRIILEEYGLELSESQSFVVANQLTEFFDDLVYGEEVNTGNAN